MAVNSWQKNLAANFIAELLAMTAFTFVDPLLPLHIQNVGRLTPAQAAFWSGIATSGLGIAMFLISPIWGLLADRFGRKAMVLRAMFGGALILSAMSLAPNIYVIIILRWLQGLVTGSVAAMTALASSIVPRNKMSFAMGIIMLAIFSGQSLGPLLGGLIADHWGYPATFYASGIFLLLGGMIVLVVVKEQFEPTPVAQRISLRGMFRLAGSKDMLPLLAVLCLMSVGQGTVQPIISLRVKELQPLGRVATTSGLIFSLIGLMAAISSFVSGRLGERISLPRIFVFCSIIIGFFYLPPVWAGSVAVLAISLVLSGLFRGGLTTSSNSMVGLSVAQGQQGVAFGLSQSAGALGNGLGPLIGGVLASTVGIRSTFAAAAAIYLTVGVLASRLLLHPKVQKVPD